ncbi:MAG: hypothetical protein WA624_17065, partial [Methylocella sp.]
PPTGRLSPGLSLSDMPFSSFGIVASCGESDDLQHDEVTASCGEVNNRIGRLFGEALSPA